MAFADAANLAAKFLVFRDSRVGKEVRAVHDERFGAAHGDYFRRFESFVLIVADGKDHHIRPGQHGIEVAFHF